MSVIVNAADKHPALPQRDLRTNEPIREHAVPFLLLKPVDDRSLSRYLRVKDIGSISLDNFAKSICSLFGRGCQIQVHLGHRPLREVQMYLLGEIHRLPEVLKTNSWIMSFLFERGDVVLTECSDPTIHFSPPDLANRFSIRRWDIDEEYNEEFAESVVLDREIGALLQRLVYMMKRDCGWTFHRCNKSHESFEAISSAVNDVIRSLDRADLKSFEWDLKKKLGKKHWKKFSSYYDYSPIRQEDKRNPFRILLKIEHLYRYKCYIMNRWLGHTWKPRQRALVDALFQSLITGKKVFTIAGANHLASDPIIDGFLFRSSLPFLRLLPYFDQHAYVQTLKAESPHVDFNSLPKTSSTNIDLMVKVLFKAYQARAVINGRYDRDGNNLPRAKPGEWVDWVYDKRGPIESAWGNLSLPEYE